MCNQNLHTCWQNSLHHCCLVFHQDFGCPKKNNPQPSNYESNTICLQNGHQLNLDIKSFIFNERFLISNQIPDLLTNPPITFGSSKKFRFECFHGQEVLFFLRKNFYQMRVDGPAKLLGTAPSHRSRGVEQNASHINMSCVRPIFRAKWFRIPLFQFRAFGKGHAKKKGGNGLF